MNGTNGSTRRSEDRGIPAPRAGRAVAAALVALAGSALLLGAQWALFYREFAPRIEAANVAYLELVTEKSTGFLYRRVESRVKHLGALATPGGAAGAIAAAWAEFEAGFDLAPRDAAEALRAGLAQQLSGLEGTGERMAGLDRALDGLLATYSDPYRNLLKDLEQPPPYLLPAALWARHRSGYIEALTLNRALYLAQTGELGTARVLLTGLQAAAEDPRVVSQVHYTLGRMDLEVVRDRPDAQLRGSAAENLRRSLQVDPTAELPRQVLAYLLSSPRRNVLEMRGSRPSDASPGEGAAITPDFRKF